MKKIKYIICGLLFMSATGLTAQGYFDISYGMAVPLSDTRDYIDTYSGRGFGLEGGYFVTEDLSIGMSLSWNGFYKDFPTQTYEIGSVSITGKMWRYTNLYPWLVNVKYYIPTGISLRPYVGFGLGTVIENKTTDFGIYSVSSREWAFGIAPEAGLIYYMNERTGFFFNGRYNYSTKTSDIPAQSNIGLNLGLIWKLGTGEFTYEN